MENNENKTYNVNSYRGGKNKNNTYKTNKDEKKSQPFQGADVKVNRPDPNRVKDENERARNEKNNKKENLKSNATQNKGNSFAKKLVAASLFCAIIGGLAGGGAVYYFTPKNQNTATTKNISIDSSFKSNIEAVAEKDASSVVGVEVAVKSNSILRFPNNSNSSNSTSLSQGSGIVYKDNGYIITNYHVVSDAINNSNASLNVYFNSDSSKPNTAKVVGYDAGADLAVLKVELSGLTPIEIGNSDEIKVGETAIAIGNPGGMNFAGSVSQGIISGLNRTITLESGVEMKLIQTDAAINPGNSGGALVDGTGKLIGISSAKLASENFEGMGFAIPSNNAISIADKLISNEGKTAPYLGITMDTRYTANILQSNGYPSGVVVASVSDGSPASKAGLKQADIITKVNGTATPSADVLKSVIANANVGDSVQLEVYRNGQTSTVTVILGSAPSQ